MRSRSIQLVLAFALFVAALPSPVAADFYEAHAYFRQQKYQKCLEVIDAIKAPPPQLLSMRAECLIQLERYPEALAALRDLIGRFPQNAFAEQARAKEIELLGRTRDFPALIQALEAAIAADPGPDSPYVKELALAHVKSGQPAKAVAVLERFPTHRNLALLVEILKESKLLASYLAERERTFDKDLEKARVLGILFVAAQDWKKAKQYLELAPPVEPTLLKRVDVAKALGDRAGQIALYEKLIALAPTKGTYYEKLGELYLAQGDTAKAHAAWREILASQGATPDNFAWLARVFLEHDFKKEALETLVQGRAVLNDPNLFHKELAEAHTALGNYGPACAEYIEMAPGQFDQVREPLLALARSNDAAFKACAEQLTQAVAERPGLPEYYFLAIDVLRIRGFGPEVQKIVDQLCAAFRNIPRELLGYAQEMASTGKREEALRVFDFLMKETRDTELWEVMLARATLLRQMGNPAEALATLERMRQPGPPIGILSRGEALRGEILLEDLGKPDQARQVFDALVQASPNAPEKPSWQLFSARAAIGMLDVAAARKVLESLRQCPAAEVRHGASFLRGWLNQLEGRFEDAIKEFTDVTMEDTGSKLANDALEAILFLTTHPLSKEEEPFLKAYFALQHYLDLGMLDRFGKEAAGIDPKKIPGSLVADFLFLQGQAQRKMGQADQAAATFEQVVANHADSGRAPQAMLILADLYEHELKAADKAAKILKDYLLANPTSLKLDEIRERIQRLAAPKS